MAHSRVCSLEVRHRKETTLLAHCLERSRFGLASYVRLGSQAAHALGIQLQDRLLNLTRIIIVLNHTLSATVQSSIVQDQGRQGRRCVPSSMRGNLKATVNHKQEEQGAPLPDHRTAPHRFEHRFVRVGSSSAGWWSYRCNSSIENLPLVFPALPVSCSSCMR